jgi:predicted ATP-dependent endonuclease of OLD family
VLQQIASEQQVIITTHSPLLIDPIVLDSTFLVESNTATAAKKIGDVRKCLGVELSDNLASASLALVVEGDSDRIIIDRIHRQMDPEIRKELDAGRLVIESLDGSTNLRHRLSQHSLGFSTLLHVTRTLACHLVGLP